MQTIHIILAIIGGVCVGFGLWQLIVTLVENWRKSQKFKAAQSFARRRNKPLLVAGGPWGNRRVRHVLNRPAHGAGDVCLDIDPNAMTGHPCGVVADVTHIPFADDSFGAAFASHLLEHLPSTADAQEALAELNRVADEVFIVYPFRQSLGGWFTRGHHLWVWQKGNITYIKQRGKLGAKKVAFHVPVE
jgi:hypothetical protein